MNFTSERHLDGAVLERAFTLGEAPGLLWTPDTTATTTPLVLLGHPGGLHQMHPRLVSRARSAVAAGFTAAALELPGSGDRPRLVAVDDARAELRHAVQTGRPVQDDVVSRLISPLVDRAVPELRSTIDALSELPGIGSAVGYAGGVAAVGIGLALVEPRIAATVLFAGSYVPRAVVLEAQRVSTPVLVLLQWDDEGNDRQQALDLFDALGSREKTLHANTGGHTGVPVFEADDVNRFFVRHLT